MEKDPFEKLIHQNFKQEIDVSGFTQNVLEQVESEMANPKDIEPLIPPKMLWTILIVYASIFTIPLFPEINIESSSYFENINFGNIHLGNFEISNIWNQIKLIISLLFTFGALKFCDLFLKSRKWV